MLSNNILSYFNRNKTLPLLFQSLGTNLIESGENCICIHDDIGQVIYIYII